MTIPNDPDILQEFVRALKAIEKTSEEKAADITWKIGVDSKIKGIDEKLDALNIAMKSGQSVERRVDFLERDYKSLEKDKIAQDAKIAVADGRKWQVTLALIIALIAALMPIVMRLYKVGDSLPTTPTSAPARTSP